MKETPKEVIVLAKSLRGHIARWAVQQSPYATGPVGLDGVLAEVTRRFNAEATEEMMGVKFIRLAPKRSAIHAWLEKVLIDQQQVQAWNQRVNGRQGMGFMSRYDRPPEPDDDFIDLDALVQNIATSLLRDDVDCECATPRLIESRA